MFVHETLRVIILQLQNLNIHFHFFLKLYIIRDGVYKTQYMKFDQMAKVYFPPAMHLFTHHTKEEKEKLYRNKSKNPRKEGDERQWKMITINLFTIQLLRKVIQILASKFHKLKFPWLIFRNCAADLLQGSTLSAGVDL